MGVTVLLMLLALTTPGPSRAAELERAIPARFQGLWMHEPRHCHVRMQDESRLLIEAQAISFYESGGSTVAIVSQGDNDLALILEMRGEGSVWLDVRHFRLEHQGSVLIDATAGMGDYRRHRCP